MRALVTGAAGFIGSHLAGRLIRYGWDVVCIDDFSAGWRTEIEGVPVNLCDITSVNIEDYMDVDVVFHQAASKKNICEKDPHRDLEVNGGGTLNLLQTAERYGVKHFIHASTGSVYGEQESITESSPTNPVSYYGVSKLAGEKYVQLYSGRMKTTILRYFHVYGPGQDSGMYGGVVAIFSEKIASGNPITIYGDGNQVRCFTHVHDVVEANIRAIVNEPGIYNCVSDDRVTVRKLAGDLIQLYNIDVDIYYAPPLPGDIYNFSVSNERIKACLGMKFNPFNEGIKSVLHDIQYAERPSYMADKKHL